MSATTFKVFSNGATTKAACAAFERNRATEQRLPVTRNGAVLTGRQNDGSFLLVYDLDVREGESLEIDDLHPLLRETFLVRTGRGGIHAYVSIDAVPDDEKTTGTFTESDDWQILHPKIYEFTMKGKNQIVFAPGTHFPGEPGHVGPYHVIKHVVPRAMSWDQHAEIVRAHVGEKRAQPKPIARPTYHDDDVPSKLKTAISLRGMMDTSLTRTRKGNRWECRHGNTTVPSVQYYPSSDSWFCFKCQQGGDAIAFRAYIDGTDNKTAFKALLDEHPEVRPAPAETTHEEVIVSTGTDGEKGPLVITGPTGKSNAAIADELATQIVNAGIFTLIKQSLQDKIGTLCKIDGHIVYPVSDREIECLVVDNLRAVGKASPAILNNITRLVRTMVPLRTWHEVNSPKHWQYITFKNGVLKMPGIKENAEPEWKPTLPGDYLTSIVIPWDYHPEAEEPTRFGFFLDYFTGCDEAMKQRVLEMMGYFLIPTNPFKKAWLIHGPRDTGKTTILEILKEVLGGNNAAEVSLREICEKLSEGGHITSLVENKLMVYKNELGGTLKDHHQNAFKDITGGKRDFTVNQKYQDPRTAHMTFKVAAATNDLPTIAITEGIEVFLARWVVEVADKVWEGAPNDIVQDLADNPTEMEGILAMIVRALGTLLARGTLESNVDNLALWIRDVDPFRAFYNEALIKDKNEHVPQDELIAAWNEWAETNDVDEPIDKTAITKRLGALGHQKSRPGSKGSQYYAYNGLRFKFDNMDHPFSPHSREMEKRDTESMQDSVGF